MSKIEKTKFDRAFITNELANYHNDCLIENR